MCDGLHLRGAEYSRRARQGAEWRHRETLLSVAARLMRALKRRAAAWWMRRSRHPRSGILPKGSPRRGMALPRTVALNRRRFLGLVANGPDLAPLHKASVTRFIMRR